MYSDPEHENLAHEDNDYLEDCFMEAMEENRPIEDCLSNSGEEVCIWPVNGGGDYCARRLIIKADNYYNSHGNARILINDLRNYIRKCPLVERITIQGSEYSMKGLGVVNASCGKEKGFTAFIAGINVLKEKPVVVICLSLRGDSVTRHVRKVRYI